MSTFRLIARLSTTLAFLLLTIAATFAGEVRTVPAPEGEGVEGVYSVKVDGQPVAIYRSLDQEEGSGEYYYGTFEFTGKVQIEIEAPFSLANATVAPERFGVKTLALSEKSATLEADQPFQISFEPNGRIKPLILFGLEPEKNVPDPNDPNVVYFGPGVHQQDVVSLKSGQTLYLAAGAVLYGSILIDHCKDVTVCGRGILAGTRWERFKGPQGFPFICSASENVVLRDIIMRDPWSWTCTFWNTNNFLVDGLRIMASNMINDDAIDVCNSSDGIIRNCFLRSQDDSIAIKGMAAGGAPCENIRVEDCVFWTDRANIFRIGYECQTVGMRHIYAKNIDVLYYSVNYRDPDATWANTIVDFQPSQEMLLSDCVIEDMRIRSNGTNIIVLQAKPCVCPFEELREPKPGALQDCVLRNVSVYGEKGDFVGLLNFQGYAEDCYVKNIKLENFEYFGEKIKKDSPCVLIQKFTEGIVIE